jgi:hypothetical protein
MAKKRMEKTAMPATQAQPALRAVRLYLPVEDHKKLRRLAADNDTNMALMARKIVMDHLARLQQSGSK